MATLRQIELDIARKKRELADEAVEIAELRRDMGMSDSKDEYRDLIGEHQQRVKRLQEELARLIGDE